LGDWVNLMGHQNAAYHIITELYTPDTIMRTGTLRNILKWYIHFEIYVSMLSGSPAVITRDWFEAQHKHYFSRVEEVPDDLNARYDEQHAWIRLIGHDISLLFRRKIEGTIPDEEFAATSSSLQSRLNEWEDNIHPMLTDKSKLVVDFSNALPREPNNIVDPNKPGVIYGGDLYPTNLVILNFLGLKNMFDTRLAAFVGTSFSEEAKHRLGYRLIQMVDSLQYWSGSPPGILIGLRANFAIAVLMLPIRKEEIQWARERFAKIEVQGYSLRCCTAEVMHCANFEITVTSSRPPFEPSSNKYGGKTCPRGGYRTRKTSLRSPDPFAPSTLNAPQHQGTKRARISVT
jgi:hypothetical protein